MYAYSKVAAQTYYAEYYVFMNKYMDSFSNIIIFHSTNKPNQNT